MRPGTYSPRRYRQHLHLTPTGPYLDASTLARNLLRTVAVSADTICLSRLRGGGGACKAVKLNARGNFSLHSVPSLVTPRPFRGSRPAKQKKTCMTNTPSLPIDRPAPYISYWQHVILWILFFVWVGFFRRDLVISIPYPRNAWIDETPVALFHFRRLGPLPSSRTFVQPLALPLGVLADGAETPHSLAERSLRRT